MVSMNMPLVSRSGLGFGGNGSGSIDGLSRCTFVGNAVGCPTTHVIVPRGWFASLVAAPATTESRIAARLSRNISGGKCRWRGGLKGRGRVLLGDGSDGGTDVVGDGWGPSISGRLESGLLGSLSEGGLGVMLCQLCCCCLGLLLSRQLLRLLLLLLQLLLLMMRLQLVRHGLLMEVLLKLLLLLKLL